VRAILGLHVPAGEIPNVAPSASAVILADAEIAEPRYEGTERALAISDSVRLSIFGKPTATPGRRMGVAVATGETIEKARDKAASAAAAVTVSP